MIDSPMTYLIAPEHHFISGRHAGSVGNLPTTSAHDEALMGGSPRVRTTSRRRRRYGFSGEIRRSVRVPSRRRDTRVLHGTRSREKTVRLRHSGQRTPEHMTPHEVDTPLRRFLASKPGGNAQRASTPHGQSLNRECGWDARDWRGREEAFEPSSQRYRPRSTIGERIPPSFPASTPFCLQDCGTAFMEYAPPPPTPLCLPSETPPPARCIQSLDPPSRWPRPQGRMPPMEQKAAPLISPGAISLASSSPTRW